jgi:hypothetical protein
MAFKLIIERIERQSLMYPNKIELEIPEDITSIDFTLAFLRLIYLFAEFPVSEIEELILEKYGGGE